MVNEKIKISNLFPYVLALMMLTASLLSLFALAKFVYMIALTLFVVLFGG